jgi:hypothetical protein
MDNQNNTIEFSIVERIVIKIITIIILISCLTLTIVLPIIRDLCVITIFLVFLILLIVSKIYGLVKYVFRPFNRNPRDWYIHAHNINRNINTGYRRTLQSRKIQNMVNKAKQSRLPVKKAPSFKYEPGRGLTLIYS